MIINKLYGRKRFLCITLFLGVIISGCAGPTTPVLRGVVTDGSSGDPLPGVLVKTDDGLTGMTNIDGKYTMSHPPGTVGISTVFAGYATYTDVVTFVPSATVFKDIALNETCTDGDGDGVSIQGGSCGAIDCDDTNDNIYPGGPPVRVTGGTTVYSNSLQSAYIASTNNDTIQVQNVTLNENLDIGQNKVISIVGGYNCDYKSVIGNTTISGAVSTNGTATIQNFILLGTGGHSTSTSQSIMLKEISVTSPSSPVLLH